MDYTGFTRILSQLTAYKKHCKPSLSGSHNKACSSLELDMLCQCGNEFLGLDKREWEGWCGM